MVGAIAQTTTSTGGSSATLFIILAIWVFVIASMWRVFTKAGQPGWAAIVPFYNYYIMTKIVGRPAWWVLLYFVPFVNFVILIVIANDLAKSFGKGGAFTLALIFFVGYPILAFGPATYQGPSASGGATGTMPPPPPMPA